MKSKNVLSLRFALPLLVAGVASTLLLTGMVNPVYAGKPPPPPPPPPVDSGAIYFNNNNGSGLQLWSMKPDGTSQTALPVLNAGAAEPSRVLHGGKRWFVTMQTIPNEFYPTDPNGNDYPRQELFAVSDQGESFQLTDNPAIEAYEPRWTSGVGGVDGRITLVGLRWVQDADGKSVSIEPGVYYIDVTPETWTSAPPAPQSPQRLDTISLPVAQDAVGYYADVSGYDWSPDGTHVVYAASDGLYIAQASDGATGQLLTVSGATSPRWSPVQANGRTQILFGVGGGHNGRIDRVNDDGSGWIAVIPALPHKDKNEARISPNSARWSPAGSHFVYRVEQYKFSLLPESTAIDRAAADGSGKTVLISVVRWCVPLGWVSP